MLAIFGCGVVLGFEGWKPSFPGGVSIGEGWKSSFPGGVSIGEGWKPSFPGGVGIGEGWKSSFPGGVGIGEGWKPSFPGGVGAVWRGALFWAADCDAAFAAAVWFGDYAGAFEFFD